MNWGGGIRKEFDGRKKNYQSYEKTAAAPRKIIFSFFPAKKKPGEIFAKAEQKTCFIRNIFLDFWFGKSELVKVFLVGK